MTLQARTEQMTHRERVAAARRGFPVDRAPVSAWRHFPVVDMTADGLAEVMVAFQRRFEWDLVKFMPPGIFSIVDYGVETDWIPNANGVRTPRALPVRNLEDWRALPRVRAGDGFLGQQNRALERTLRELGPDVPVLQTVFSPLTTARKLAGDAVFDHLRSDPAAGFGEAFQGILETTREFARNALELGAGIFYATQCGTGSELTDAELLRWEIEPARRILGSATGSSSTEPVIVHIHGPEPRLDLFSKLEVDGLNWHDRTARPNLAEARALAPDKLLVGGLDGPGTLFTGTPESVAAEASTALAQTGGHRLLLAPGCVIPIDTPEANLDALRASA